jgi:hypothetical protein
MMMIIIMSMGETSQNRFHQRVYCSPLGWYVSVYSHGGGGDAVWGKLTCPPELPGSSTSRHIWERVGRMDKGVRILRTQYLRYVNGSLRCRKILWHGTSSFTSRPKEGVPQIFIALKNPSLRPGLNPRPLCPVANTLTTTPSSRLVSDIKMGSYWCHVAKLLNSFLLLQDRVQWRTLVCSVLKFQVLLPWNYVNVFISSNKLYDF